MRGRWMSAVRASHLRYVSRHRQREWPRKDARFTKRLRIDEFIGGARAIPF